MRYFYISFYAASCFLLFSCNSKTETSATASEIDNILSQQTVKPPVFKDSLASAYTKEYHIFVEAYLLAIKNNDAKGIKKLQKQSEELIEKAKVVSGKLKTPAELEQYGKWMQQQQQKIKLLNNIK